MHLGVVVLTAGGLVVLLAARRRPSYRLMALAEWLALQGEGGDADTGRHALDGFPSCAPGSGAASPLSACQDGADRGREVGGVVHGHRRGGAVGVEPVPGAGEAHARHPGFERPADVAR